ncbi:MAG: HAD family hydrolase [Candidatus Bipolaricaulota bacterium]
MNKDKVVFDLDGVLLDSETNLDWLDRALCNALDELGIPVTQENVEKLYPGELRDFEKAVKEFSIPPDRVWKVRDKYYVKEKLEMITSGKLRPYPDVKSLHKLKDEYSLGIISNSPAEVVDQFVRKYELNSLFQAWVGRGSELADLANIKPATHLFKKLKREMGEGGYLYVGDREVDKEFAENAGISFLYLRREGNGFKSLNDLVEHLLRSDNSP